MVGAQSCMKKSFENLLKLARPVQANDFPELPEGDWVINLQYDESMNNKFANNLYCSKKQDIEKLQHIFPAMMVDKAKVSYMGALHIVPDAKGSDAFKKFDDISNILSGEDSEVQEMSDCDIIDEKPDDAGPVLLEVDDSDIVCNIEDKVSSEFQEKLEASNKIEKFLSRRDEMGIRLEYVTKVYGEKNGSFDFRFWKSSSRGNIGNVVSSSYVKGAINALKTYDSIMTVSGKDYDGCSANKLCGDYNKLKKAVAIVDKYFTKEARDEAIANIDDLLEKKSDRLVNFAACSKEVEPTIARQIYSKLIATNQPTKIAKAIQIARNYMSQETVNATESKLWKILNKDYGSTYFDGKSNERKNKSDASESTKSLRSDSVKAVPLVAYKGNQEYRLTEQDIRNHTLSEEFLSKYA